MDKDKILETIWRNKVKTIPLPEPFESPENKQDISLVNRFKEILLHVGGGCFEVNGEEELASFFREHFPGATDFRKKEIWKVFPSISPKDKLVQLKTIILEAQFGVAENAAVWFDEASFPNRLVPFIAEELVVCLNSNEIIRDMLEAYSRLGKKITGFGVFISGPSKTADIEQHLIFGAHGAICHNVVIY